MKEYDKMKATQANQLGSIDQAHPMKQIAIMSVIQVVMLAGMVYAMYIIGQYVCCLLYTSPSPRDGLLSRMPSSA